MAAGLVVFRFRGELHSLLPSRFPFQPLRGECRAGRVRGLAEMKPSEDPGRARTRRERDGGTGGVGGRRRKRERVARDGWNGEQDTEGCETERERESIAFGNSNLHLFYYIIIPTRRSISGALKRRFSNRSA